MPVAVDGETGRSFAELALTTVNAKQPERESYRVGSGLHGVGLACVNMLSDRCDVLIERDGRRYAMGCEKGIITRPFEDLGETHGHGTTITWVPDSEIFGENKLALDNVQRYMRNTCYLLPEVTIQFRDLSAEGVTEVYHFERGVGDLVAMLNKQKDVIGGIIQSRQVRDQVLVDVAFQYTQSDENTWLTFANNVHTGRGGTHHKGGELGLKRALTLSARKLGWLADGETIGYRGIRRGLTGVVSIRHHHPWFEGATKARLGNDEVKDIVAAVVEQAVSAYLEQHPDIASIIIEQAIAARRTRLNLDPT